MTSLTLSDPDGTGGPLSAPVTTYTYDVYARLSRITDPLTGETDFTYDANDNLLTLEDAEENLTTWAYDPLGRVAMETNELNDTRSFTYDAASNLTRKVDRNGRVTQFVYDNLDRLSTEEWRTSSTPPSVAISTTTEGGQTIDEVQRVGFTHTGMGVMGTFTLTFNGQTTSGIAWNASAATVQSALEALSNIGVGDVSVTKIQDTSQAQEWQIAFQGALGDTNLAQTTINTSGVTPFGGSKTDIQNTQTQGSAGGDEVQQVTLSNATGGTFRMAFLGYVTAPLNYNASAADVDAALEALPSVDTVSVTGSAGGPWTVTFTGTHANQNVSVLQGDAATAASGTLSRTLSYAYDAASQLTSASDPTAEYDFVYDNLGRATSITHDLAALSFDVVMTQAFDAANNRTSLAATINGTADFKNTYTFDALNRLTRLDQTGQSGGNAVAEKRIDLAYNALGQFSTIARYKDTDGGTTNEVATATYSYDTLNRLTGVRSLI